MATTTITTTNWIVSVLTVLGVSSLNSCFISVFHNDILANTFPFFLKLLSKSCLWVTFIIRRLISSIKISQNNELSLKIYQRRILQPFLAMLNTRFWKQPNDSSLTFFRHVIKHWHIRWLVKQQTVEVSCSIRGSVLLLLLLLLRQVQRVSCPAVMTSYVVVSGKCHLL